MSKFVVLGDTHFGCRNDLQLFHKHFAKFYDWMFHHMEDMEIDTIYQLGDLWDRRKYVNFHTLAQARSYFFDRLESSGYKMITLVGNHDIYWRENVSVNSSDLLLRDYNNIDVIMEPTTVEFDDTSIDVIPWICQDNEKQVREFIKESKSDLCIGHFEIATFQMYRGMESHDGLPIDMFAKYEKVFSGHYHTRSERENIVYCGTPYEMTWQDYNDPKGFHVFDTETRELTFYENPYKIFYRVEYDDTQELVDLNALDLADTFTKVVVTNKTDLYKFDQFIQKLYNKGCYEVKIVEDMAEFSDGEIGEEIDLEDTMDVLSNYIDSIDTSADKEKIKLFMKTLYVEAVNLEVV